MTSVAVGFLIGIISNQYVKIAGSITVKHLNDSDPVCVLTAHGPIGPIKSTPTLFQGSTWEFVAGRFPYCFLCNFVVWHILHVEQYFSTWCFNLGQVNNCLMVIINSVLFLPGCAKYSWYQATMCSWSASGTQILPSRTINVTFYNSMILRLYLFPLLTLTLLQFDSMVD
jgi:hypothetical protein